MLLNPGRVLERASAAAAVSAVLAWCALQVLATLDIVRRSDWWLYDHARAITAIAANNTRITIVVRGDSEVQRFGGCVPDSTIARALDSLISGGARAIGVDLLRDTPLCGGARELSVVAARATNVAFVVERQPSGRLIRPASLATANVLADPQVLRDADGVVRRAAVGASDSDNQPLAYAVARLGGATPFPLSVTLHDGAAGAYQTQDSVVGTALLPLPLGIPNADTVPLLDVLDGTVSRDRFRDRFVLIGSTAISAGDRHFISPANVIGDDVPGVYVHAALLASLLEGSGITPVSEMAVHVATAACVVIGASFGILLTPLLSLAAAALSILAVGAAGVRAMHGAVWIPIAAPLFGLVLGTTLAVGVSQFRARQRARLAQLLFSQFVTRDIADAAWRERHTYLSGGRPAPMPLPVTVLFLDLRGFTSSAEQMDPVDVMRRLSVFTEAMTDEITKHGGLVDDYAGDGIKADFGAPIPRNTRDEIANDARGAVRCALAIARRVATLDASRAATDAPFSMRIGLHSGLAVAGTIGGAGRLKYTIVGDTVNVASRLESLVLPTTGGGEAQVRILASRETKDLAGVSEGRWTSLGALTLKGRQAPVEVWQISPDTAVTVQ